MNVAYKLKVVSGIVENTVGKGEKWYLPFCS